MGQQLGQISHVLLATNTKPYFKLSKLIQLAKSEGIITEWEAEGFDEELTLLVNGENRSYNTIPRSYILLLNNP